MSFELTYSVMRVTGIVLVIVCGGCGSSAPDESTSLQSPPMAITGDAKKESVLHPLPVGDTTMAEKRFEENMNKTVSMSQPEDHATIPLTVAKDLQSPEARDRYRALDYWEAEDSKAPLDPVFEAIEDDDPAVRAKATAIVDRYWEADEKRESQ